MSKTGRPTISAMSAGFQFAVCVLLPVWLGYWAERRYDVKPWGLLAGLLVGLLIGTWSVFVPLWREADDEPHVPKSEDDE
jgi:F0F1-type ATP synthase assembly protein I